VILDRDSKPYLTFGPICVIFGSQVQGDKVNRPKFIDLFCGIGGMRLAFESAGAQCVFSSDWDKYAQQTYAANFGHAPAGNIREIQASDIPDHDILVAGFPCQPFSISGVSKKKSLGREHGFRDDESLDQARINEDT
jgi:DNA (cytosine-5)-methyltransferase 1